MGTVELVVESSLLEGRETYKPVLVTWLDSTAQEGWHGKYEIEEFTETPPLRIQTLGCPSPRGHDLRKTAWSLAFLQAACLGAPKKRERRRFRRSFPGSRAG